MVLVAVLGLAHLLQACQGKGYVIVSGESDGGHAIRVFCGGLPIRISGQMELYSGCPGTRRGSQGSTCNGDKSTKARRGSGNYPKAHKIKVMEVSFNHLVGNPRAPRFTDLLCADSTRLPSQVNPVRSQRVTSK